jgi:hypothetical protein
MHLELSQPLGALDAAVQRLLHSVLEPEPQVLQLAGAGLDPDPFSGHPIYISQDHQSPPPHKVHAIQPYSPELANNVTTEKHTHDTCMREH